MGSIIGLFFTFLLAVSLLVTFESVVEVLRYPDILFDQRKYDATAGEEEGISRLSEWRYLDKYTPDEQIHLACIQSDIIKDDYLKLFIPYQAKYDSSISTTDKKIFSAIVTVSLNDSLRVNPGWFSYRRVSTKQKGIITYLSIDNLPKGKNELTIKINGQQFYTGNDKFTIPFWK